MARADERGAGRERRGSLRTVSGAHVDALPACVGRLVVIQRAWSVHMRLERLLAKKLLVRGSARAVCGFLVRDFELFLSSWGLGSAFSALDHSSERKPKSPYSPLDLWRDMTRDIVRYSGI